MTVTVFTKPHCPQCDATKRQLTKLGVPFETVDLTQNPSVFVRAPMLSSLERCVTMRLLILR